MYTKEDKRFNLIGHIIMIVLSFLALIPIVLMVISSLTDDTSLIRNGYSFFPEEWSLYAYQWIFVYQGNTIIRAYAMSFLVTAIGVVCSTVFTICLAYGLSKKNLPGGKILTFYVFFTMLFNGGLVPTYINYTNVFHIKDTIWALIIPSLLMNAFYVLLMKSYMSSSVPQDIIEAAYMDGAGEMKILTKIMVPLSKPIIATVALFSGIAYWNDWNNGYIYLLRRTDLYTIQNLLNRLMRNIQALAQNANSDVSANMSAADMPTVTVRMAIAALGVLPIIVVYPFVQKNFVKGITLGGVKG